MEINCILSNRLYHKSYKGKQFSIVGEIIMKGNLRVMMTYASIAIGMLLLLILLKIPVEKIFTIIVLLFLAAVSKIYKQFTGKLSFGFELITPVVILFAYKISILFAICSAVFLVIIADFLSGKLMGHEISAQIGVYVFISIVVGIFSMTGANFVTLAIVMIFIRNLLMWTIMVIPGFIDPIRASIATIPNFIINSFIIKVCADLLLRLLY